MAKKNMELNDLKQLLCEVTPSLDPNQEHIVQSEGLKMHCWT